MTIIQYKYLCLLLFAFVFSTNTVKAEGTPGCKDLYSVLKLVSLEESVEAREAKLNLRRAYSILCSRFTPKKGATVSFRNGTTATYRSRTEGASWYYPNGQVITHRAGIRGATWYYPNGNTVTYGMGNSGTSWYYINGEAATHSFGVKGASWYYPNGQAITHSAGVKGATWYYSNGKSLSSSFGKEGATWYYEDGSVWTLSAVELSENDLLYPTALISILLREARGDL